MCYIRHDSLPHFTHSMLPCIIWPDLHSFPRGFPVKTSTTIASIIVDFGVLLTFGCMNPPLAVVVCVCITSKTLTKELLLGRYVTMCREAETRGEQCTIRLQDEAIERIFLAMQTSRPKYSGNISVNTLNSTSSVVSQTASSVDSKPNSSLSNVLLEFPSLHLLELSCHSMWETPHTILFRIVLMALPLFVLYLFDLSGINLYSLIVICIGFAVVIGICGLHSRQESSQSTKSKENEEENLGIGAIHNCTTSSETSIGIQLSFVCSELHT